MQLHCLKWQPDLEGGLGRADLYIAELGLILRDVRISTASIDGHDLSRPSQHPVMEMPPCAFIPRGGDQLVFFASAVRAIGLYNERRAEELRAKMTVAPGRSDIN